MDIILESEIRDFFYEAISTYGFITAQKELDINVKSSISIQYYV